MILLSCAIMYVLTGASSVGKTSVIKALEARQEPVIHEAATDWIQSRIDLGVQEFWKEEHLGFNILKVQIAREEAFLQKTGRVFIDRGIFDNYAYTMQYALAGTETLRLINHALHGIDMNQRYRAVFLLLPHTTDFSPLTTEIRRENNNQVMEQQAALYAIYSQHKNFIIVPGDLSIEERMEFILKKIALLESS